jgi:hypothetical protein
MEIKELYANFRDARLIQLLKVEANEGAGTQEDPIRRVVYFIEPLTGKVLWNNDDTKRLFAGEDEMKQVRVN